MKKRFIAGLLSLGLFVGCMVTTSAFTEETVANRQTDAQIGNGYSRSSDEFSISGTSNTNKYRNQKYDEMKLLDNFGYTVEELEEEGYKFIHIKFVFRTSSSKSSAKHTLYLQNNNYSYINLLDPLDFTLPEDNKEYLVTTIAIMPIHSINNQICLRYQLHAKQEYEWNIYSVNATGHAYPEYIHKGMRVVSIEQV